MDLVKLLQDLLANVTALQVQLADADAALGVAVKASYDQGFADGVASVPTGGTFTQADVDAAVLAAVEPLNLQIVDLQAQVTALQVSVDQKIADAVAAVKAELLLKFLDLELQEKTFEDLLK